MAHAFLDATVHIFIGCLPFSVLLSFISVRGSQTDTRIAEELNSIEIKNGIASKITDNASNIKQVLTVSLYF